jgi:3'-phosphoadenosine 5'-phosphosulfate sulfotransferase (PAPS reductase)/FAD synthetase
MTIKVLVPISGGKDSQAALKLARQQYEPHEIRGLFCDTQFEHPITYQHVERLRTLYGPIQIDTVSGGSVLGKAIKYKRFPGGGARHCTDELKIRETKIYCKALAEAQGGFEVWYGMRTGESHERAKRYAGKVSDELYAPHEVLPSKYPQYLAKMGVMFRLCILDWTTAEVLAFLAGEQNPLYAEGFPRVGCFPCLASGDAWKEKAFARDDFGRQQLADVMVVSAKIGKSIWTSKGGQQRNATCALACSD